MQHALANRELWQLNLELLSQNPEEKADEDEQDDTKTLKILF